MLFRHHSLCENVKERASKGFIDEIFSFTDVHTVEQCFFHSETVIEYLN